MYVIIMFVVYENSHAKKSVTNTSKTQERDETQQREVLSDFHAPTCISLAAYMPSSVSPISRHAATMDNGH
jgi:hypothetical protein